MNTGGKEYYKLIGYFMGRAMEMLENSFWEISTELEETIMSCDDLLQMSEIYNMAQHSESVKEFAESMRKIYGCNWRKI